MIDKKKDAGVFDIGLDIGMASVGWCLLADNQIIDLGVRAFDKAESTDGKSLNLARREKRLLRRCLRRRAYRLLRVRRLFKRQGLIAQDNCEFLQPLPGQLQLSPWELRTAGLSRELSDQEWARSLYHLLKHRGFQSNRKSEINNNDQETGKLLAGITNNLQLLINNSESYRTPAELACRHQNFADHKRNKAGDYSHTFARKSLGDEVTALFAAQRALSNSHADEDFEKAYTEIFWAQRPPLTGEAMLKLVGHCTYEKQELRVPKRCYSAERFVWLSKLNNLRVMEDGERRPLTKMEWQSVVNLPLQINKVTYKSLRNALKKHCGLADTGHFAGLSYHPQSKSPEDATLMEYQGWHSLRKAYEAAGLQELWRKLSLDEEQLNVAGWALTVLKTDAEITDYLLSNTFSQPEIDALLNVSFRDFIQLSLTAIKKLLPLLEQGLRYDEAVAQQYGNHSNTINEPKTYFLPAIDKNSVRNPVVFRALNQARKVVNAIVREYGSPRSVHIELARDLSRSFDERQKILKEQQKFQERKQADIDSFTQEFGFRPDPKNQDLLKWRLYREQNGQCVYSQQVLAVNGYVAGIFAPGQTQIDHILPYSRTYDDSVNNKVLVLTRENQDKANRTPYEYLDGVSDSDRWRRFEAWVRCNVQYREAKRQRLLRKHFDAKEAQGFRERNLNDTRYICRYFKNHIENYLQLAEVDKYRRCVVVSGQLTAFLRARWGLIKVRSEGDLHHALDAVVVAACSHAMVKRLSDYARLEELSAVREGYTDPETGEVTDIAALRKLEKHFPEPWPNFRAELLNRLSAEPVGENLSPVLVSRAPKRRNSGAAHKETIRSKKRMAAHAVSSIKTPLARLKLSDLPKLAGCDDPRNQSLYCAIEQRLLAHKGDAQKAFGPHAEPLYKPGSDGTPSLDPQDNKIRVRSVRVEETQKSGLEVRHGIADNDTMLRVDLFKKGAKYFLVPLYVADKVRKQLPDRAIIANKPESAWDLIDNSYTFLFSLYPNDFVVIKQKGKPDITGYYGGCDRATGAINVWVHDRNRTIGKDGLIRGIGVKTSLSIEKYHVDVLGRRYKATQESRCELA